VSPNPRTISRMLRKLFWIVIFIIALTAIILAFGELLGMNAKVLLGKLYGAYR
jgi:hypothetical protein